MNDIQDTGGESAPLQNADGNGQEAHDRAQGAGDGDRSAVETGQDNGAAEHPWSLGAIAHMTRATVAGISPEDWRLIASLICSGVALDSRSVLGGEVFVALPGSRVDGHGFISASFESGAAAVIARRGWWSRRKAARALGIHLLVDDPVESLQHWAAALRQRLNPAVVAVTGSSGKSTAKEMILALLRGQGSVVGTLGNRNNQIGLPWTLLQLQPETPWAVVEMGTNQPGEIAALSRIARPNVAVLTCIGRAHEGHLGAAGGVLSAKLEILEGLAPSGTLVIPDENPELEQALAERWSGRILRFGFSEKADVRATDVAYTMDGTQITIEGLDDPLHLRLLGEGSTRSALAALAATRALEVTGIDPAAMEQVEPMPGRLHGVRDKGVTWLLDMYNASPESTLQNLRFLEAIATDGRKVFVFGGMRELGESSEVLHQEIGRAAGFCDAGVFLGDEARAAAPEAQKAGVLQVLWCHEIVDVVRFLRKYLKAGDTVLLKGARSSALEGVAQKLGVIDASYGKGGF